MAKRKRLTAAEETPVLMESMRRCCLCYGLDDDGRRKPGQIAHLDRNPANNASDNLMFLCLNHHGEYDSTSRQAKGFTAEEVRAYHAKMVAAENAGFLSRDNSQSRSPNVVQIGGANSIQAGRDANIGQVNIRISKGKRDIVLPNTVATEASLYNYLEYLVRRYNEFKEWECKKNGQKLNFAAIRGAYKGRMKSEVRHTPIERFDEAADYLQDRIRRTFLGRLQNSKGQRLFESFEEFSRGSRVSDHLLPQLQRIESFIGTELTARATTKDDIIRRFMALKRQYMMEILHGNLMWQGDTTPMASSDPKDISAFCELDAEANHKG